MHLHKHQVYSLEQHSQSEIWSAIIRINSEGKSLIMIIGPGKLLFCESIDTRDDFFIFRD